MELKGWEWSRKDVPGGGGPTEKRRAFEFQWARLVSDDQEKKRAILFGQEGWGGDPWERPMERNRH